MNWINMVHLKELDAIKEKSAEIPQVIFKHSSACGTSHHIKEMLDQAVVPREIDFNFLDLLEYRDISAAIAIEFKVKHESPQLLLIRKGKCIYHKSHYGIRMERLQSALQEMD
ncbi:MAG: bacillithiol system redox-active protein YtxJ [Chitinophagales bacterium]